MQSAQPRLAGVILAAGASTRFGSPKQLAQVGERTMLEAVVEIARAAGLTPIMAVVPPGIAVPPDVIPIINARPEAGLSRSLQLGFHSLPEDVSAAVILLGDQPTLDPAVVRQIVAARGDAPVVAVATNGLRMPPVLVERVAFGLADGLDGDAGLRSLLRESSARISEVVVGTTVPDIDTPEDLARLGRS